MKVTYREPCGCKHDGHTWTKMCEPCGAEFGERHQRAQLEHEQRTYAPPSPVQP